MANIEIWENLWNNFFCKKYRENTRCSTKDSQSMVCYKYFSYFEAKETIVREIEDLFDMITLLFAMKDIWWPFVSKTRTQLLSGKLSYPFAFCANLMKLAAIF